MKLLKPKADSMYRITKGDITIEASTEDELHHAVKVLTDQNLSAPTRLSAALLSGSFSPYEAGEPVGRGYLGEYIPDDYDQVYSDGAVPMPSGSVHFSLPATHPLLAKPRLWSVEATGERGDV